MASVNNLLIGGVRVESTLESGKFVDGAKKVQLEAKKTETVLKKSFGGAAAAVKGFGGALTAGLSIGLLAGVAKKALDFAAAIGTTAKQLGVGTKELQLFRHAADQMGVKNAEADKALERLGVTLGKAAAGSTSATKALGAVGVTLKDIETKSRTEIFGKIADQMIKQGGAAKNAAAANAIFGESASKLTPLLDKGSRGIGELSAAAERLGIVLSDRQIQQADQTAQKLDDVRAVLSAQIAGVVADNAASIVSLANALAKLASAVTNFLGSNPQAALGILGALAGSRFGLPGAAAGGIAGLFAGGKVAAGARDASMDPALRASELRRAKAEYARTKTLYGGGPAGASDRQRAARELLRQDALGKQALAAAKAAASTAGTAAIPQFLAPAAKGGGRKRTPRAAKGPRDRSDDVAFQFDQEMRRAQMDTLRAQHSLSRDYSERASLAVQMLDLEKEMFNAELDNRVRRAERDFAEGKIDAATLAHAKVQAEQLKLEYDKKDSLERQAILDEEAERTAEEASRFQALVLDLDRDLLESRAQLAETAAERRKVELELLDFAYRQRKAALDAAIAQEKDAAALQRLTLERDRLMETYANNKQGVINSTRGPLEEYAASLPLTADKMNEALENVAVNGLKSLEDGIISVIDGTKSLGEAFREMAAGIISDLLRISIQKAIIAPLANSLFPGTGFEAGGFTGFATGGFTGWGSPKSIAGIVHKREGVLNMRAMQRVGIPTLNALNSGAPLPPTSNDNGLGSGMSVVNNFTIAGDVSRKTQMQIAARVKQSVAGASRGGYG
jgi:hypothetical protein